VDGRISKYRINDEDIEFSFVNNRSDWTSLSQEETNRSFANKLVILLGELDDRTEKRGTMLHTPSADVQGLGRYERGKYFYNCNQKLATSARTPFHWQLRFVERVGHDYKEMGVAAANLLYGQK